MKRTIPRLDGPSRDVAKGELIGLAVRVAESTDKGLVGLTGSIVDESLRTFTLRKADGREVRIGKAESVFEFEVPGRGPVRVPGAAIEFRSEDRTKKVR
jgi:RNase P/RNase MRP subunit p29